MTAPCIFTVAITGSLPGKRRLAAFDLSMSFRAAAMQKAGNIGGCLHGQFVMGIKNAVPGDRQAFQFFVATLAPWNAALVRRTVEICERHAGRPATAAEARRILRLAAGTV